MVDDVQAALRRSEQHLAAAQRITHCGSWELDLGDLVDIDTNPLRWSDEVFRIFGYEPGAIEVTNENFFRAVHPDDRSRIAAAVRAALESGAIYSIDHRVIRPDGSVRIVHEQSEIQYGPDGKPQKMIGTVQDVTDQRTTEAQLVTRDRMASVGTLAAGVAHEINNPLTAVCANLELLGRALSRLQNVPPELHENVRDAKDGADRVRAIVRDLMLFSRADDQRTTPTEVKSVLDSALRLSAHEYKHHAEIVRDYQEIPYAAANEARLGQVFLNLLRNAAYATRTTPRDHHEIRLATRTDARGRIVVTIADTGGGIPDDVRSRLFTPFFSTKPVGEGTGLGLSICQRIVADLGGEISFTSEPGRGTEFRVVLPPSGGELDEVTPPPPPPQQQRRRILIIDDEELITSALQALLSDEHEVMLANDPASAREAFATGASYDVILCDLMMPGITGMQLHAELGATDPALAERMIFMTGGTFSDEARAFLKTGVRQIEKPFAVNELRKLIAEATRS